MIRLRLIESATNTRPANAADAATTAAKNGSHESVTRLFYRTPSSASADRPVAHRDVLGVAGVMVDIV